MNGDASQNARRFTLAGRTFRLPHVSDECAGAEYRERERKQADLSDRQISRLRAARVVDIVLIH